MDLIEDYSPGHILVFLITVTLIIVSYYKYKFSYWSRKNVPFLQPSIPFGNMGPQILQKISSGEIFKEIYDKLKDSGQDYGGIYATTRPVLLVLNPELAKHVMAIDFSYFHERPSFYDEKNDPLSAHLVNLNGIKWKNLRSKLTPTFTSGKMKMMYQTIAACSSQLKLVLDNYIEQGQPIDIKDAVARFTTDIIGSCAFGIECNSLKNPDTVFRKYGKRVFEPTRFDVFKSLLAFNFPRIFKMLGLTRVPRDIHHFFMNVVKETVEYREKNDINRKDFMQLLIQLKNDGNVEDEDVKAEPGTKLTLEEIAAQAFVFFLAGFETSSTTACFFMYDMVMNQDIQEKVRKEINDVIEKHGELTYDAIMDMHYLEKAVFESMRLHSGIPLVARKCVKDYKVPNSDLVVEKGTSVLISTYGFHNDSRYFSNPQEYNPERFSKEEKAKRHPYLFLPFGEGPRNCIGLRFGLLQTKVGLAVLLQNHRYTLHEKTKIPLTMEPTNVILSIQGGLWLKAERV